jgi:dTDP-4-dehydrorhamnose 3,5-epimerase
MKCTSTEIPEVIVIEPKVFSDDRGFFFESFNQREFNEFVGRHIDFVQDNHSRSRLGVLRGLHYQLPPRAQGKLVRVVIGEIFDVAVDIRAGSPTCGCWVGEFLSASNRKQLWIPPGFAHAFLTLSESAEVIYKATDFYSPELERCILWKDPQIGIPWPLGGAPVVSPKDENGVLFVEAELFL